MQSKSSPSKVVQPQYPWEEEWEYWSKWTERKTDEIDKGFGSGRIKIELFGGRRWRLPLAQMLSLGYAQTVHERQ